jgi:8-oxo-dGTP pyrophosphatase MutT (NUDIX family)
MFPTLSTDINSELHDLAERFGQPIVHRAELSSARLFDPLNNADRYGEVCMVVRRPGGRLLTAKKTFYPEGCSRLMTGGINHGEKVFDALLRETQEETGLEVAVRRFLVAASYHLANQSERPLFYTFAFLLDEVGGVLECQDEHEHLEYFREIEPEELPARAEFLAHLPHGYSADLGNGHDDWSDWGEFRAVIHRQVWQALQDALS